MRCRTCRYFVIACHDWNSRMVTAQTRNSAPRHNSWSLYAYTCLRSQNMDLKRRFSDVTYMSSQKEEDEIHLEPNTAIRQSGYCTRGEPSTMRFSPSLNTALHDSLPVGVIGDAYNSRSACSLEPLLLTTFRLDLYAAVWYTLSAATIDSLKINAGIVLKILHCRLRSLSRWNLTTCLSAMTQAMKCQCILTQCCPYIWETVDPSECRGCRWPDSWVVDFCSARICVKVFILTALKKYINSRRLNIARSSMNFIFIETFRFDLCDVWRSYTRNRWSLNCIKSLSIGSLATGEP